MSIAIGYTRVSTSKQADSGLSLEAQRAAVTGWCDEAGIHLEEIYEDAGVSGSTPVAEREGLMSALARARELGASHLVVSKLDRLSRSPFILLTLEQGFSKTGLRITSTAGEGTESDDPSSVLVRRMLQAVAEHELQMIRARTRAGMAAKKARGERVGRPPYGFTMEDGVIVRASTFPSVRECLSLYCEWDKHDWSGVRLRYNGLDLRPSMRQVTDRMIKSYPNDGWTLKRTHSIISRWKSTERLENWNG
jgi:DNA invertase Pin-like site-specific DNA recombinase